MDIIKHELDKVKNEILQDFKEPFAGESITDFVFNNSKMVRAILCVLYLKTNGITLNDKMYKILSVGELIHNASLLHDDVIDNSELRRGNCSVWKKYDSKIAVLLGDYVLNYAIKKIYDFDSRIINEFQSCINSMCLAEFKQYFLRDKDVEIEDYIDICKNKTASLFCAILKSCLISENKNVLNAQKFAEKFGIYFQLLNDFDEYSLKQDKRNKINTTSDILGIEKAEILIDNYKQGLLEDLKKLPENKYRYEIERLVTELCMIKKN